MKMKKGMHKVYQEKLIAVKNTCKIAYIWWQKSQVFAFTSRENFFVFMLTESLC